MKSRPILFSGSMVRAVLDGSKTQTRRVGKIQSQDFVGLKAEAVRHATLGYQIQATYDAYPGRGTARHAICACPFGQPGDQLWVRETWYCDDYRVSRGPYLKPDDLDVVEARECGTLVYAADGLAPYETEQPAWRPSIHMPRWASRITLELTGVRVERLQDISIEDCKAEGAWGPDESIVSEVENYFLCDTLSVNPRLAYQMLWERINGDKSWDANPWVWVVEFKRVTP
jgi:hypothetical protein